MVSHERTEMLWFKIITEQNIFYLLQKETFNNAVDMLLLKDAGSHDMFRVSEAVPEMLMLTS